MFLVFHSIGYVIHSVWLMRLADFYDYSNGLYTFAGMMIVGMIIGCTRAGEEGLMSLRDKRRFERARHQAQVHDREQISSTFSSFEMPSYREKYVDLLASRAAGPTGQWPDGLLPNHKDVASVKLARLEHDWLGLNK
jgi:hypothetical protein